MAEPPKATRWECCCCGKEYALSSLRYDLCPTCKREEDAARRIVTEKPEEEFPLRETLDRVRKIVRDENVQFPTWEELAAMRDGEERVTPDKSTEDVAREALKPFAELGQKYRTFDPAHYVQLDINVGDLHRARAALNARKEEKG